MKFQGGVVFKVVCNNDFLLCMYVVKGNLVGLGLSFMHTLDGSDLLPFANYYMLISKRWTHFNNNYYLTN